ncbi:hypothetical protein RM572_24550 [Streptomyces sp. DSM 42041]|uniref:Integral membrane protein n=2 Tax=Streptomyces hazeniae TaxID=3075538 RepID=A0ABU2NZH5_9ACTN|nr:hypothetical protein [Streptomyces sp. DSM 42041]MDT0381937.1 hypothetical protein [Streptomyces sp. DSM 42041]
MESMAGSGGELRKDLDATLQTRKELGPEYEDELVESFLAKLDGAVERRVRRQLAERQMEVARGHGAGVRGGALSSASPSYPDGLGPRLWLAVTSLVLAVPLSAIAVVNAGLAGLLVCWTGVVAVNAVQAARDVFGRRGSRDADADDWG